MRLPDKPGEYRVRSKASGEWRVSGLTNTGTRVRHTFPTEGEARAFARRTFETSSAPTASPVDLDDWGLPRLKVSADTVASMSASLGIPPQSPSGNQPPVAEVVDPKETPEAKKKREQHAQSLMELVGMAWAAGDVMIARRITESAGKNPVKPNPKQVTDLAESMKDTLVSWFGDKAIKPWQMTILLSLGIPISMMLQSQPKTPAQLEEAKRGKADHLKSVP